MRDTIEEKYKIKLKKKLNQHHVTDYVQVGGWVEKTN